MLFLSEKVKVLILKIPAKCGVKELRTKDPNNLANVRRHIIKQKYLIEIESRVGSNINTGNSNIQEIEEGQSETEGKGENQFV